MARTLSHSTLYSQQFVKCLTHNSVKYWLNGTYYIWSIKKNDSYICDIFIQRHKDLITYFQLLKQLWYFRDGGVESWFLHPLIMLTLLVLLLCLPRVHLPHWLHKFFSHYINNKVQRSQLRTEIGLYFYLFCALFKTSFKLAKLSIT